MDFKTVKINKPKSANVIIGQSHFIKTAEDIYEVLIYDSNLSNADKNEVGNYLATKYTLSWTAIT